MAPHPPIVIRDVRAADRPALEAVLRSDSTFHADELDVAIALIDGAIAGDPDYRVLVTGEVEGYLCYGPTAMTRASFDLYWIVVAASARGRGLGAALIGEMERRIGHGNVRVETSPAHGAARAMYERLGYPLVSELAGFYRDGESLLTYYKRL